MEKASKIVGGAIIGMDSENVTVNGRRYVLHPPTIHQIASAAYYLSGIGDGKTVKEVLSAINETSNATRALSCLIAGDVSLYEELSQATLDEVLDALEVAYSLMSAKNFTRLSALARSVANLTAKQKP